jgi:hypothetical protein
MSEVEPNRASPRSMDGNNHRCDYNKRNHKQDEQDIRPLAPPPHDPKRKWVDQQQDPRVEHQSEGRVHHLQE